MPIKATQIQNQLITQLGANANIASEFAGKIAKGLGRNFDYNADGQGIRIFLTGSNSVNNELPDVNKLTYYDFLIIVLFFETSETETEDRKAKYEGWVYDALESDLELSGQAMNITMGVTRFAEDPKIDGLHYAIIPITVQAQEGVAA